MGIKNYTQISTKKGDKGVSRNYSNEEYGKDDSVFDTLGTIDELSAALGLSYHYANYENLKTIQMTLQAINALVATNFSKHPERYQTLRQIKEEDIAFIEREEAAMLENKPIEPRFFLPGSEARLAGAYFDVARTVCRRAERTLVHFISEKGRRDLEGALKYLNRLSDLLFILARNFE